MSQRSCSPSACLEKASSTRANSWGPLSNRNSSCHRKGTLVSAWWGQGSCSPAGLVQLRPHKSQHNLAQRSAAQCPKLDPQTSPDAPAFLLSSCGCHMPHTKPSSPGIQGFTQEATLWCKVRRKQPGSSPQPALGQQVLLSLTCSSQPPAGSFAAFSLLCFYSHLQLPCQPEGHTDD